MTPGDAETTTISSNVTTGSDFPGNETTTDIYSNTTEAIKARAEDVGVRAEFVEEKTEQQVTEETTTVSDDNTTISITANPSLNQSDLYVSTLVANRMMDVSEDYTVTESTPVSVSTTESDNVTLINQLSNRRSELFDSNDTDTSLNNTLANEADKVNESSTTEIVGDATNTTEVPTTMSDSTKVVD